MTRKGPRREPPGDSIATDLSTENFDKAYYRNLMRAALRKAGDRAAAGELLGLFADAVAGHVTPRREALIYIAVAARRILAGMEPAKAFGLAREKQRPKKDTDRLLRWAASVELLRRRDKARHGQMSRAIKETQRLGASSRQIERAWQEYKTTVQLLADAELEAIIESPPESD